MKVSEILTWKNTKLLAGKNNCAQLINGGYTSDLLSDVMGNADENMAWITMQTHKNVIAIASLKELACVIIVNNNKPSEDMIEAANNEGIPVIVTELSAFEFSGLLYRELNQ
jgi:predicted transcriptional regulator